MRTFGLLLVSAGVVALAQEQPVSPVEPQSLDDVFNGDAAVEPLSSSLTSLAFQYTVAHFPFGGGWSTQVMLGNSAPRTLRFGSASGTRRALRRRCRWLVRVSRAASKSASRPTMCKS